MVVQNDVPVGGFSNSHRILPRSAKRLVAAGSATHRSAKPLQFFSEWLPIDRVKLAFGVLLSAQRPVENTAREMLGGRQLQERAIPDQPLHDVSMSPSRLNQELGSSQLAKPEKDSLRRRLLSMVQIVDVDQTANHRPVFVSLSLL